MSNLESSMPGADSTRPQLELVRGGEKPLVDMSDPAEMRSLQLGADKRDHSEMASEGQLCFDNPYPVRPEKMETNQNQFDHMDVKQIDTRVNQVKLDIAQMGKALGHA